MLRHDHIGVNLESETAAHTLQRSLKGSFCGVGGEQLLPVITGKCDEMTVAGFLKSFQSPRHEARLCVGEAPLKPKEGLNGAPSRTKYQIGKPETLRCKKLDAGFRSSLIS